MHRMNYIFKINKREGIIKEHKYTLKDIMVNLSIQRNQGTKQRNDKKQTMNE